MDYSWLSRQPFPQEANWLKAHPEFLRKKLHEKERGGCGEVHYLDQPCSGYGTTLLRDMPAPWNPPKASNSSMTKTNSDTVSELDKRKSFPHIERESNSATVAGLKPKDETALMVIPKNV